MSTTNNYVTSWEGPSRAPLDLLGGKQLKAPWRTEGTRVKNRRNLWPHSVSGRGEENGLLRGREAALP